MRDDRRNIRQRAALVQRLTSGIVENPSVTLTIATLQAWLGIPGDAAQRTLGRLVSSGLVREVQRGMWTPAGLHMARY